MLTSDVFKQQMPKQFILLKLDNLRDKFRQTPDEIAQYEKLSAEYKVKGVPTIIVADAQSKEQHRQVGYSSRQTAQEWVAKLIAAVKAGPVEKVAKLAPAPKLAKVYKILPGIDLSKFTAKQKTTTLKRANKE